MDSQVQNTGNVSADAERPTRLVWQKLTPAAKQRAIHQINLVNLFKQVNPELRLCPPGTSRRNVSEKGIQVPDRRLPKGGFRKQTSRRDRGDYAGPSYRMQSHPRSNREDHRRFSLAENSVLRPDAPPHIPESIRRRTKSDHLSPNTSLSDHHLSNSPVFDDSSGEDGATTSKKESESKGAITRSTETDITKNEDKPAMTHSLDSSEDGINVVVEQTLNLERKWGYFFCRKCFHGWVSGSVWCIKGSDKVYIQQTCNFCNVIVQPKVEGKFRQSLFSEKWTPADDAKRAAANECA